MSEQTSPQQSIETESLAQNFQVENEANKVIVLSTKDAKDLIEVVHREIHYEHGLISNRMSWYVTSQSFLMAAFAVVGGAGHNFLWLAKGLIPPLGIVISLIIWISLLAALVAMHRLRAKERALINLHDSTSPFGSLHKRTHLAGMSPPALVPFVFLIAWIVVWIMTLRHT